MLQRDDPADYVVSSGATHSERQFCEVAFGHVGLDWEQYVRVDPDYFRPAEVVELLGDSSKAMRELGWEPEVDFVGLVRMMAEAELERWRHKLGGA